jgi:hypothetical protein
MRSCTVLHTEQADHRQLFGERGGRPVPTQDPCAFTLACPCNGHEYALGMVAQRPVPEVCSYGF